TDYDDSNPWWQVDLQATYNITSVTIANRFDSKEECDGVTIGRWVKITKPTELLILCEVEVTGTLI
ncbi:fucolectin-6-like, partial [Patella vulgata]|uniref:fucolectin-6-like n=1 Tax=Patella vulgata TaxID=6465 RepID=UPI0024A9E002